MTTLIHCTVSREEKSCRLKKSTVNANNIVRDFNLLHRKLQGHCIPSRYLSILAENVLTQKKKTDAANHLKTGKLKYIK